MTKLAMRLAVLAACAGAASAAPAASRHALDAHAQEMAAPAKELFGAKAEPTGGAPRPIGFYSRGCLTGAAELPITGPHWQVMRLSRNRHWGMPALVSTIEDIATKLPKAGGWDGVLVGDMSQPRGGPMRTGHLSHQIGLDVDIWLTPWPDHTLSVDEREKMSAVNVVAKDWNNVNPHIWSQKDIALIETAAKEPRVERVLVNPAIKKELCRVVRGDRSWLNKVRPYWGHHDHIHVRISCPKGVAGCREQAPPPPGDGCGADLAWWFSKAARTPPKKPAKPKPPITLADLPKACAAVLNAPGRESAAAAKPADATTPSAPAAATSPAEK